MCGRLTQIVNTRGLQLRFDVPNVPEEFQERYNAAPTQRILVIRLDEAGDRRAELMTWGLIPTWTKDPKSIKNTFNARSETVGEKPMFRSAFKSRRCLIPSDGFYEWQATGKTKTPLRITLGSGEIFSMAGLWEPWRPGPEAEWHLSCTILTCEPNELMSTIHNRMPVILRREDEEAWLDPSTDLATLRSLMMPFPSELMTAYQVSPLVGNTRNDIPELIVPVA